MVLVRANERKAVIRDEAGGPLWVAMMEELGDLIRATQISVLRSDIDPQTRHDKAQRYGALRQFHDHILSLSGKTSDM